MSVNQSSPAVFKYHIYYYYFLVQSVQVLTLLYLYVQLSIYSDSFDVGTVVLTQSQPTSELKNKKIHDKRFRLEHGAMCMICPFGRRPHTLLQQATRKQLPGSLLLVLVIHALLRYQLCWFLTCSFA